MNILHVTLRYPPAIGGSETWCHEVARYARRHGCRVRVLTTSLTSEREFGADLPDGERTMHLGARSLADGVEIHRFPRSLPRWRGMRWLRRLLLATPWHVYVWGPHSLSLYRELWHAVRWADIVHLHTLPYPHVLVGFAWSRLFSKPVVITPWFHMGNPDFERPLFYALLKRCEKVVVMTERERDHLQAHGVSLDHLLVVGCGIDPSPYAPATGGETTEPMTSEPVPAPDQPVIIFLGRKEPYKGIPILLEAFRQVRQTNVQAALRLVGPRTDWFLEFWRQCPEELKFHVTELDQVITHDVRARLLRQAAALVLPSRYEAFGIVLLESWLCGTPVVVPEGTAPADVAEGAGLCFRLDDASDLARQLGRLLDDPPLRRELAERGRAKVLSKYTSDHIGAITLSLYASVLRRRRRVLIVSFLYAPEEIGGSEVVAALDAEALAQCGWDVRVFCGRVRNHEPRYSLATPPDAPVVRVNLHSADLNHRERLAIHLPLLERQFRRCLEVFQPDVVHFHNIFALSAGFIDVCRMLGIPTVMTLHDYWPICIKNTMLTGSDEICRHNGLACLGCERMVSDAEPVLLPVRNTLMKLRLRQIDRFIAPSRYVAERFVDHGVPWERMRVIPYGIKTGSFGPGGVRGPRHGRCRIVFGYIGYWGMHKGVEFLVRAIRHLRWRHRCEVRIAGVGDPPYVAYLRTLSRDLDVGNVVRFMDRIPHDRVAQWYGEIDALVLPAIWPENEPVTVLEAMAAGRPVIASAVGGLTEMIQDGKTGLLVPPADAVALAKAMDRLIEDPTLRSQLGCQAAQSVRRMASMADHIQAVERVHAEAMAGNVAPPVALDLVACAGFGGRDASAEPLLRLWRLYCDTTGNELPDVCDVSHLSDEQLREAKALVVPAWQVQFADGIERAARCGVPILGLGEHPVPRWVPRGAVVRSYGSELGFVREVSRLLHGGDAARQQEVDAPESTRSLALTPHAAACV